MNKISGFLGLGRLLPGLGLIPVLICLCNLFSPVPAVGNEFSFGFIDLKDSTVFSAIKAGATEEAAQIRKEKGDTIKLVFKQIYPPQLNQTVEAMVGTNQGIAISAWAAAPIQITERNNVPLVMYGATHSELTQYKVFIGIDDFECGKQLFGAVASVIQNHGRVELLGLETNNPDIKTRIDGATAEAKSHPQMQILGPDYCGNNPEPVKISQKLQDIWAAKSPFEAWLSLFNLPPDSRKAASWTGSPAKLVSMVGSSVKEAFDDLTQGRIEAFALVDYYEWGKECVRALYKLANNENLESTTIRVKTILVTRENMAEKKELLRKWFRAE
jgi:ABC-type sugar transport system substrate-binding protein